ncbi:MAG: spheroidene monooxygenase [Hyphomicrobiaceae bacterium]|nr:spheroidene monooxygenase [Hyphomicrobiaceae bacterium]
MTQGPPTMPLAGAGLPVTTLSAFRFATRRSRLWAFGQMQFARGPISRIPHIGFFKLMGTGSGESFSPQPNWSVYAVLATWPSLDIAEAAIREAPPFCRYRDHAVESITLYAETATASGLWNARAPFAMPESRPASGLPMPLGVLTRATIRTTSLRAFWAAVPDVSDQIARETGVLFKLGMGEVPWVNQVTFSVWRSFDDMRAFAYRHPAHREAIRQAKEQGWFKEDLFARFRMLGADGTWNGRRVEIGAPIEA